MDAKNKTISVTERLKQHYDSIWLQKHATVFNNSEMLRFQLPSFKYLLLSYRSASRLQVAMYQTQKLNILTMLTTKM